MNFSAQQIAAFLHGEVIGDASVQVNNLSKIEEGKPGTIAFLANKKYTHFIYDTQASIVLVNRDFVAEGEISATLIKVDDAYASIAQLLNLVEQARPKKNGIESNTHIAASATYVAPIYVGAFSYIDENATIGENVQIYPQVFIGENVTIGNNVVIRPGVKIYHDCVIGNNCIIHAGAVIGADGFGFAPQGDSFVKIAQIGNVVLEDDVEIGANTTIDRSTMGSTIIRKGVKLDNLIQIAHNVEIGSNTVMAAQVGIAGSSKVGSNCFVGGQAGMVGHITLGDRSEVAAQTGITHNMEAGSRIVGFPAISMKEFAKNRSHTRRIPTLEKRIAELEQQLKQLKAEQED